MAGTKIKVATYNIRHGKGTDGRLSLGRVARTLEKINAHIVGLQEVDRFLPRSLFRNQAGWLARRLGMRYAFAPNLHFTCLAGYGNAVLSKIPIVKTGNTPLPGQLERRGLQYCLLSLSARKVIYFFNTHLGLSTSDRNRQARAIATTLPGDRPVILAGDFNAGPEAPELKPITKQLRRCGVEIPLPTYPARRPQHAIDHIFISPPYQVVETYVYSSQASDHLPLVCVVNVP